MKISWVIPELVEMFSLHNICPDQVPFSKRSFLLHEVTVDIKEAVYLFCLLLSMIFFVLMWILKLFTLHHLCIKLCWIQKYKFYWCKTTTAGVMGQGPQNSYKVFMAPVCPGPRFEFGDGGIMWQVTGALTTWPPHLTPRPPHLTIVLGDFIFTFVLPWPAPIFCH